MPSSALRSIRVAHRQSFAMLRVWCCSTTQPTVRFRLRTMLLAPTQRGSDAYGVRSTTRVPSTCSCAATTCARALLSTRHRSLKLWQQSYPRPRSSDEVEALTAFGHLARLVANVG